MTQIRNTKRTGDNGYIYRERGYRIDLLTIRDECFGNWKLKFEIVLGFGAWNLGF